MVQSIEYNRTDDCRQGRQLRVMEVIKMLCERPVTRYRIANRLDIDLRTVDRYLTQINELGFKIKLHPRIQAKEGDFNKYSLEECPFCKKKL